MNPEPLEPGGGPQRGRGSRLNPLAPSALQFVRNLGNLCAAPGPIYKIIESLVRAEGETRFLRFRPLLQALVNQNVTSRNLSLHEVPVRFLRFRRPSRVIGLHTAPLSVVMMIITILFPTAAF
jgi:hypothetical protein